MVRASERVFVTGQTESGKSYLLWKLWAARHPRCLILDRTGESIKPGRLVASRLGPLVDQLRKVSRQSKWQIVGLIEPEEFQELAGILLPEPDPEGKRKPYPLAIGGMALVMSEADIFAPNAGCPVQVRGLWQRGRHAWLSIYADSQAPAFVNRAVTSQSGYIGICRIHEPRHIEYCRKLLPEAAGHLLDEIPEFGCVLFRMKDRATFLLDRDQRPVKVILSKR